MININKIIVKYNGDLKCAFDISTRELMERYLSVGMEYEVIGTGFYEGDHNKPFYVLSGRLNYIYFPINCFIQIHHKELIKRKYDLR